MLSVLTSVVHELYSYWSLDYTGRLITLILEASLFHNSYCTWC